MRRYNTNLALDTSFGTNGSVSDLIPGSVVTSIKTLSDGSILVAGWINHNDNGVSSNDFFLAKYTKSGARDTTFGNGQGWVYTNFCTHQGGGAGSDTAYAIAVQSNGKIILAGGACSCYAGSGYCQIFALARYNSNGTIDSSFGTNGKTRTVPEVYKPAVFRSVNLLSDGKIIGVGNAEDASVSGKMAVVRYLGDPVTVLQARPQDEAIALSWEADEGDPDTVFHVWRSAAESECYQRINAYPIPVYPNSFGKQRYSFLDRDVSIGLSYSYKLETLYCQENSVFSQPITMQLFEK